MSPYPTAHAYHRAWERYGLNLTVEVHAVIVNNMGRGCRARRMGVHENAEIWYVHTPKGPANILFDPRVRKIITFLPKGIVSVKGIRVPRVPTDNPRPSTGVDDRLEDLSVLRRADLILEAGTGLQVAEEGGHRSEVESLDLVGVPE